MEIARSGSHTGTRPKVLRHNMTIQGLGPNPTLAIWQLDPHFVNRRCHKEFSRFGYERMDTQVDREYLLNFCVE